MNRRSRAIAGVLSSGAALLWAAVKLTPTSHDFGQIVVNTTAPTRFQFMGAPSKGKPGPPPTVTITGPDAAAFVVDSGRGSAGGTGPAVLQSSCLSLGYQIHWTLRNPCDYLVHFQPHSVGVKTARMVVVYLGETVSATLRGEGIAGCRAYLVTCNYADLYSGEITIKTVDSTSSGTLGRIVRYDTNVDITITNGVASCSGMQSDFEEEYNVNVLQKRSSVKGVINGPGLFAVEFRQTGGTYAYVLQFDCPTASITTTDINYIDNTTSTGHVASRPAEWRHASLVADPQPATQVGMVDLVGKQKDIHTGSAANDEGGYSSMVWKLKRQ